MSENDNGKRGAAPPVAPPLPPPDLSPGNIAAQVVVIFTKDKRSAVLCPSNPDKTINLPLALDLLAEAVKTMANILREQGPQEASRIVLVPGLPPGVDLRGRAGK